MTLNDAKRLRAVEDNLEDALRQLEEAEQVILLVASYRDRVNSPEPKDWGLALLMVGFAENYLLRFPRAKDQEPQKRPDEKGMGEEVDGYHVPKVRVRLPPQHFPDRDVKGF